LKQFFFLIKGPIDISKSSNENILKGVVVWKRKVKFTFLISSSIALTHSHCLHDHLLSFCSSVDTSESLLSFVMKMTYIT
jgi:hypothetical protein